ncbi:MULTISPECIES: ATP-binding protein [Thermomonosporaceae]|uniref:ATP-binding protein n=1 Tax=Thermomonosporaceae TaxID=2012 RepID=UPI00255AA43C|nr:MULTISPECIES: ATP-binding protein [Thermomonosporaceae]MDL4772406.1 ATP-binding protein [Actinomadura xylanilytica]
MTTGHLPDLLTGGCSAWPLPADETCAATARSSLRAPLKVLDVPDGVADDITLAASELATNALRYGLVGGRTSASSGSPLELWAYHRSTPTSQLVFKVFDPNPGWTQPDPAQGGLYTERGRGIAIVEALSSRWGWHQSRSRLSPRPTSGKVTWFCVPMPRSCTPPRSPHLPITQAARVLQEHLAARGLNAARCEHDPQHSFVMIPGVTISSEPPGTFRWYTHPNGTHHQRPFADLNDVVEAAMHHHEQLLLARENL